MGTFIKRRTRRFTMNVQFVAKNITLRDHFKSLVEEKITRLNKYFRHDTVETTVTLSTEGSDDKRAEITIRPMNNSTVFRADQTSKDLLESVDMCIDSLISQISKNKTKMLNRRQENSSIRYDQLEALEDENGNDEPEIARTKYLEVNPMSAEEACLQMELIDHDFFLFRDPDTNEINAVYKRKAGNYGLLIPE